MRSLLLLFLFASLRLAAQREYADSLLHQLPLPVKHDSVRCRQYAELAWAFLDFNHDSARLFAQKAITLSRNTGFREGELDARNTLGILYRTESQYAKAIALYQEIISERQRAGEKDKLTGPWANLGSTYYEMGKYGNALSYYQKAYELARQFHQDDKILLLANNIGVGYKKVGLYEQSLDYFQRGLAENRRINDPTQQGTLYANIATVYQERNMYADALHFSEIAKSTLDKENLLIRAPNLLYNMVLCYTRLKDFKAARRILKDYYQFALKADDPSIWSDYYLSLANFQLDVNEAALSKQSAEKALSYISPDDDPADAGVVLNTKAQALISLEKFPEALQAALQAERYVLQSEDSSILVTTYEMLADVYEKTGKYKEALAYTTLANELTKRIERQSISTKLATMNALNHLEQKEQQLEIAAENNKRITAESERKSIFIYAMIAVGLLVVLLMVLAFRSSVHRKKANRALREKNSEIDLQKSEIEARQEEILASIHYAKRIQETLLAQRSLIHACLPASFIFFRPKDIVSGDFYWASKVGDELFIAICDSTGHGVPGAFMSALNTTFLNEAVNQLAISDPGQIFDHVRNRLIASVSHDGARDGMDGTLLKINYKTGELTYAAAYNAPVVVRHGGVIKAEADKMPVGLSDKTAPFTTFSLALHTGDRIFLSTDGYIDQFGGTDGKKLKWKGFAELLLQADRMDTAEQFLSDAFGRWIEGYEQIDDVCVFGFEW